MSTLAFASGPIDRAAHHRKDADWLEQAARAANVRVLLMRDGDPFVSGDTAHGQSFRIGDPLPDGMREIVWLAAPAFGLSARAQRLFLGIDEDGAPCFALNLPTSFDPENSAIAGLGVFENLRPASIGLSAFDAQCAATARAIFSWHQRHGYCANCGTRTDVVEAGWKRECEDCGTEHFPRVDPVAIMLAVKGDKCLLGRQSSWPPQMWSCLAGFIEPGETPEQGAMRELFEEAGVRATGHVEYLFSQPWPFPTNLMIGLIIEAESEDIVIDKTEIEDARWFSRAETRQILAGTHPLVQTPPPITIAHHILTTWADRDG